MGKQNKKIILIVFITILMFVFISCNNNKTETLVKTSSENENIRNDEVIIDEAYTYLLTLIPMEASSDLFLLDSYNGVSFTYESSNLDVLSNDGKVKQSSSDTFVTLNIYASYNETQIKKEYIIIIRAKTINENDYNIEYDKLIAKSLLYDSFSLIDVALYTDIEIDNLNILIENKVDEINRAITINEINDILESFYDDFNRLYNDLDKYIINALKSIDDYLDNYSFDGYSEEELERIDSLYNNYYIIINDEISSSEILKKVSEFKQLLDEIVLSHKNLTSGLEDVELPSYYDDIDKSLIGLGLKMELRNLITVTHKYKTTYNDLKTMTAKSDADPETPGNIITIYSRLSVKGTWDGGSTWNREHVWPQSKGWFTTSLAGSDLHHLHPETPSVNSSRGNKIFGVAITSSEYYPGKESCGDVARTIFYLLTRYSESDTYNITSVASSMELLLKWNNEDPVDDFERNRNEVVYSIQGNRNPFIDYSDFANLIWGTVDINVLYSEGMNVTIQINYCLLSEINKNKYI